MRNPDTSKQGLISQEMWLVVHSSALLPGGYRAAQPLWRHLPASLISGFSRPSRWMWSDEAIVVDIRFVVPLHIHQRLGRPLILSLGAPLTETLQSLGAGHEDD
jgi:hypothetical protein